MEIIIFDTETTGLLKPSANELSAQPYITELYALKVRQYDSRRFDIIGEYEQMFKVPVKLDEVIVRITGITDKMLANKPTFNDCFSDVSKFFLGAERMVAHNLPFDRSMMANEMLRCDKVLNFPWPRQHVCTVEKSMAIEQRRMNLQKLHTELMGKPFEEAHRAKNDVMALYDCYQQMVIKGMII